MRHVLDWDSAPTSTVGLPLVPSCTPKTKILMISTLWENSFHMPWGWRQEYGTWRVEDVEWGRQSASR